MFSKDCKMNLCDFNKKEIFHLWSLSMGRMGGLRATLAAACDAGDEHRPLTDCGLTSDTQDFSRVESDLPKFWLTVNPFCFCLIPVGPFIAHLTTPPVGFDNEVVR
jgi:hypothetical protein